MRLLSENRYYLRRNDVSTRKYYVCQSRLGRVGHANKSSHTIRREILYYLYWNSSREERLDNIMLVGKRVLHNSRTALYSLYFFFRRLIANKRRAELHKFAIRKLYIYVYIFVCKRLAVVVDVVVFATLRSSSFCIRARIRHIMYVPIIYCVHK